MDTPRASVLDASERFLRTNPELVAYAERHASSCGATAAELLQRAGRLVVIPRAWRSQGQNLTLRVLPGGAAGPGGTSGDWPLATA